MESNQDGIRPKQNNTETDKRKWNKTKMKSDMTPEKIRINWNRTKME